GEVAEVRVLADDYLGERDGVEQLSAEELSRRLERGDVVVLDVRPEAEFRAGHIAGARSAPVDELDALVGELSKRRDVVAYCRGPYCVYADDAVRLLRSRGLKARRLDVGDPEGQRAGLPGEVASWEEKQAAAPVPERCRLLCELSVGLHDAQQTGSRRRAGRPRRGVPGGGGRDRLADHGCVRDARAG